MEAGSRLEIEVLEPVKTVVSHVITNCQLHIKWAGSTTRSEWCWRNGSVSRARKKRHARAHLGRHRPSGVKIAGQTAEQVITGFTETWYENFDRRATGLPK